MTGEPLFVGTAKLGHARLDRSGQRVAALRATLFYVKHDKTWDGCGG
jgi:hypothetical protein